MKKHKTPRKNTIVIFDPPYGKEHPDSYYKHPLSIGEQVLYLGAIINCPGHSIVADSNGKVHWMIHTDELREAKKDEL